MNVTASPALLSAQLSGSAAELRLSGSAAELRSSGSAAELSPSRKSSKLADAAQQFEALMIGEMMKSAREDSPDGWLGSGSDSSEESAMGIAESQFAQAIARRGGFGLARMIEQSMSKTGAPANSPPAARP
jgi:peptidoglycan hydrolase FlgJ